MKQGGSGKSTVAMHIAVALIKSGQRVATIDLDARQKSFTHFIENRRAWAKQIARDLQIPDHFCFGKVHYPTAEDEAAGCKALTDAVDTLSRTYGVILIDTPGHDSYLMRLAHSLADTLITPLNDSFVDLDVLGTVDPRTFRGHRDQPLFSDGAGGEAPAPPRSGIYRLDCFAESTLDDQFAQQASGRWGTATAFAMA